MSYIDRLERERAELLEACRQIVWKTGHNWDDGLPARIDRRDIVVTLAANAAAYAQGHDLPFPDVSPRTFSDWGA